MLDVLQITADFLRDRMLFFGGGGNLQVHIVDHVDGLIHRTERIFYPCCFTNGFLTVVLTAIHRIDGLPDALLQRLQHSIDF